MEVVGGEGKGDGGWRSVRWEGRGDGRWRSVRREMEQDGGREVWCGRGGRNNNIIIMISVLILVALSHLVVSSSS